MKTSNSKPVALAGSMLLFLIMACSFPGLGNHQTVIITATPALPVDTPADTVPPPAQTEAPLPTETVIPSPTIELPTATVAVAHALTPSTSVDVGKLIYDVTSVDTAAENRAPYGDSYKTNMFERPFLQDMTYVPDLDIISFNLSQDEKFYYVSIELVGKNPNNPLGIHYAVELDTDADGFGDAIILARPPYDVDWSTNQVLVVRDTNRDTGGLSAENSDAPLPGDGYDTVIFDSGVGADPDLAWVRINAGKRATVQFAFKIPLAENRFMYGVLADAGLKDITSLDYVDRFTEEEAGSPVRNDQYYPLKALYGVDNVCRDAHGFTGNWEEPQRCPKK